MNNTNQIIYEQIIRYLVAHQQNVINSMPCRLGHRLMAFKSLVFNGNWKQLVARYRHARKIKYVQTTFRDKKEPVVSFSQPLTSTVQFQAPATTIYTCIVGKYDAPKTPLLKYSNCRYILFTDQENISAPGWEIRPLPPQVLAQFNPTAKNRYLKFHPHEFFDTPYAIYIDGNVQPLTSWADMLPPTNSKTGLGMFTHPYRNCIYTEAKACLCLGKGNKAKLNAQIAQYQQEGFPAHYGLNEATLIATDLHNPKSKEILEAWWAEFLRSGSNRDQIALPYVLWKMGLKPADIENLGEDIRQDLRLQIHTHNL